MNENENLRVRIVVVETIKSNVYFYIAFILSDSEHMRCLSVCEREREEKAKHCK